MKTLKFSIFIFLFLSFFAVIPAANATVVAAIVDQFGDITMGADSCEVLHPTLDVNQVDDGKIVLKSGVLIGFAGDSRALRVIRYQFIPPEHEKGVSDDAYMKVLFPKVLQNFIAQNGLSSTVYILLAGYRGKLYQIGSNGCIFRVTKDYHAVGSGYAYALGSLNSTKGKKITGRLILAMESAASHNVTICAPWQIEYLRK